MLVSGLRQDQAWKGKVTAAQRTRCLLIMRQLQAGTDQGLREHENTSGRGSHGCHLLDDAAAERHVSTTEDVRHVTGHLQVILAIHTRDLGGNGDHMRHVTACQSFTGSGKSGTSLRMVRTSTKPVITTPKKWSP